jgi:diguanylate cyclase (GGDEF)-like protein
MQEASDRAPPQRQSLRLIADQRMMEPEPMTGGRERAMRLIEKKLACTNLRELLKLIPDCFENVKSIDITICGNGSGNSPSRRLSATVESHPKHGEFIVFEGASEGPKVNMVRRQLYVERSSGDEQIGEIELFTLAEPPLKLRGSVSKEDAEAVFGMISALVARTVDASLDGLTMLSNRKSLDDCLAKCSSDLVREGRPFSAIMLDVDHFKAINDRYGHNVGDNVLARISSVLLNGMRSVGLYTIDSVARFGGEEFVILLQDVSMDEASHIAERLRKSIRSQRFYLKEAPGGFNVTCSFGVAQAQVTEENENPANVAERTLKAADSKLYEAKSNGRDRVEPSHVLLECAVNS